MKKRLISFLLAVSMMLTFLPVGGGSIAFADEGSTSLKEVYLDDVPMNVSSSGKYVYTLYTDGTAALKKYDRTYQYANVLETITYEDQSYTVTEIGPYAFGKESYQYGNGTVWPKNNNVTSIYLPKTIETIGEYAFGNCAKLTTVSISASAALKEIGEKAFWSCKLLEKFNLPEGLETIGDEAFENCEAFTSVTIPSSVTSVGKRVFEGCKGLTSATVKTTADTGTEMFENCTSLSSVTLPDGLETISATTFRNCTALTSIEIPSTVKAIDAMAFQESGLEEIVIPASVERIGYDSYNATSWRGTFQKCTSLKKVTIEAGENALSIPKDTFNGCTALKELTLPKNISEIGQNAFSSCTSVDTVTYSGTESEWNAFLENSVATGNDPLKKAKTYHFAHTVTFDYDGHADSQSVVVPYEGTVTAPKLPTVDGYKFDGYYSDADHTKEFDFTTPITEDTTVYAKWILDTYDLTVTGGSFTTETNATAQTSAALLAGDKVTVTAEKPTEEGVKFHHWTVEKGGFTVTEGSLGSEKELGTEEINFNMPNGAVELTAVYSKPASTMKNTYTIINSPAKEGEEDGTTVWAEIGSKVEITAAKPDQDIYPGTDEFDYWEIVYPDSFEDLPADKLAELKLQLTDPKSQTTSFVMPAYPVKLIAHWKSGAATPEDPNHPMDDDFGQDSSASAAGAAIVGVAIGGAAILGGYEVATRVILNKILPDSAAIPANRGELAMLIWTEKGKPEPAAQPAFTDVDNVELAKAAQWCIEQGLLDAKDGKFRPNGWMPKFKTIEVWNRTFPKQ